MPRSAPLIELCVYALAGVLVLLTAMLLIWTTTAALPAVARAGLEAGLAGLVIALIILCWRRR